MYIFYYLFVKWINKNECKKLAEIYLLETWKTFFWRVVRLFRGHEKRLWQVKKATMAKATRKTVI